MFRPISPESNDSDFFMCNNRRMNQVRPDPTHRLSSTPQRWQATETREKITLSSIASPGPQYVTIDSASNEPTMP